MRVPLAWLKTYLPKLPATPKLVETLMMHGLDVEEIIENQSFDRVVVGKIVDIQPHPNADKLRLASVLIEPDREPQVIVCGAPNIEVGQKVPVALLGAQLPNGLTIAKRAIRGVESNGMLCAADELGLGSDHSGILVLDKKLPVGTPFGSTMINDDTVIDLAIPANRADLMAMRGLAWEIGAMLNQTPKFPPVKLPQGIEPSQSVDIEISDQKLCTLFTIRTIRGLSMKPTPEWMANRLRAAGMRSVNIIADITNYVMLEYGQPLHAYDATKVHGHIFKVRSAKDGEQLKTLDGKNRTLSSEMIVIADQDRSIGLAGVMGGEDTEVTSATTDVYLEAAIFDPVSIRKTSRRLGLLSEASKRFEKGLWPSLPEEASAAATALMVELCGGRIEQGIVRTGNAKSKEIEVTINPSYISERLGAKISATVSKNILKKLGFTVKPSGKKWSVRIPDWRPDVSLPEDIVDEIGRMNGYDNLPESMPESAAIDNELPPAIRFKEEIKNILVDLGCTEVISHAFYSEKDAAIVKGNHFEVANPLDVNQHKLRKSLLPQIHDVLHKQADAGNDAVIFETGLVFNPDQPGSVEQQQSWKLALGMTHKGKDALKEIVNKFQQTLITTIQPQTFTNVAELTRGRTIEFCEFDLKELRTNSKMEFGPWNPDKHIAKNVTLRETSKYPAIVRDISFWWTSEENEISKTIDDLCLALLRDYSIKDTFTKDGKTSYALSFMYQSTERTLTKEEVDKLEQKIKDALMKRGATIR